MPHDLRVEVMHLLTRSPHAPTPAHALATAITILVILASVASPRELRGAEAECGVLYQTSYGVYIDLGLEDGLKPDTLGWISREGERLARVRIEEVSSQSAFLRVLSILDPAFPDTGTRYRLTYDAAKVVEPTPDEPSATLKEQGSDDGTFIPLLARPGTLEARVSTDASNIFRGRLTVSQLLGAPFQGNREYSITRIGSSGTLDRIESTPWSLEWNGDLTYRDGDGLDHLHGFQEPRLRFHRLLFTRRFDDHRRLAVGRFIPRELPSVGFLDGAQAETPLLDTLRVGGMMGFKPDRRSLDPSFDEPTLVGYVTLDAESESGDLAISSTGGLLFSLYEGQADRMALLDDTRLRWKDVDVFSSLELDLDVGAAEVRGGGPRLTRWDVYASWFITDTLTLRGGWDRYERPDTEAERTLLRHEDFDDLDVLRDEYWRVWIGADHELGKSWRLSEELAFIDSEFEDGPRWRVSLTRRGLPGFEDATATLSAYSLESVASRGFGVRLSAHVPLVDRTIFLQPSVAVRYSRFSLRGDTFFRENSENFYLADLTLRGQWIISRSWMLSGGTTLTLSEQGDQLVADIAATFRW